MWATLIGSLTGLAITLYMTYGIYEVSLKPLMDYDYNSFYISQTKSSVYSKKLFNPQEIDGKIINKEMFSIEHLVMLPAVDVYTKKDIRPLHMYIEMTYKYDGNDVWFTQYSINLNSIYDKHITFNSISPSFTNVYSNIPSNFYATVSGIPEDNTLIFYIKNVEERGRSK